MCHVGLCKDFGFYSKIEILWVIFELRSDIIRLRLSKIIRTAQLEEAEARRRSGGSCRNANERRYPYLFARAAVAKCHKLGGLTKRHLMSHSLEGRSLESRCQQGHVPSEGLRHLFQAPPLVSGSFRCALACRRLTPPRVSSHQ